MKLKRFFPRVFSLIAAGFVLVQPCSGSDIATEPEVSIPEQSPAEQEFSASLPEPLVSDQNSSAQISSPPAGVSKSEPLLLSVPEPSLASDALNPVVSSPAFPLEPGGTGTSGFTLPEPMLSSSLQVIPGSSEDPVSFSIMRRTPQAGHQEPANQSQPLVSEPTASPSSIITIRSLDPAPSEPAQADPVPLSSGASVSEPVQTPRAHTPAVIAPPEPPRSISAAEPKTHDPADRESPPLPGNPLPETPSQISSLLEPKQKEAASSRTIWAIVGQEVAIPFRGNGWVYLGEQENRQGIRYSSRGLENEGQKYIFKAESAGTYTLKFYRQDFIEDFIINEYVQVIISENPVVPGMNRSQRTEAPGLAVPPPETPDVNPQVQASGMLPSPERVSRIDYLQQAREAYTAGQFPQALSLLDQFRELYPAGTDEAWWLYAQSLEANSPSRDIRSALDYYRRLIREYPQSPRGTDAQRRIAYLERYYFNIR
jgi:hypothetical protein